jgi:hypothetical protein
MLKIAVLAAIGAALALLGAPALAQQGTSSSYGSVGWGSKTAPGTTTI